MDRARAGEYQVRCIWVVCSLFLLVGFGPVGAQQGYEIAGSHIVVEQARHWEQWKRPTHLTRIDSSGTIRSRPLRTVYNLLADRRFELPVLIDGKAPRILNADSTVQRDALGQPAVDLQGNQLYDYLVRPGVSRVGSNPGLAAHILDGDPTTFWEPNPEDPIEDWWIEVDLARPVSLERLRLEFVEEGLGDPFYRYIMFLSTDQTIRLDAGGGGSLFIAHEAPNTEQRVFVFDSDRVSAHLPSAGSVLSDKKLVEPGNRSPDWTGRDTRVIRLVMTDTRGGRAAQISQAEWEALAADEQGDIVYFVRDIAGREEPETAEVYASLPPERQGRRDYYRRELPRLAEVEAWGWGDDLGPGIVAGGGAIDLSSPGYRPTLAFDADMGTYFIHRVHEAITPGGNVMSVDLGGTVWLDQIRITGGTLRGYTMRGSSGGRDAQGQLQWQVISPPERAKNLDNGYFDRLVDPQDPPLKVRFLDLIAFAHYPPGFVPGQQAQAGGGKGVRAENYWPFFREIKVFGAGAPAEVVLESDLIELPGLVTLGGVDWQADTPSGTRVEIHTRTGDQLLQRIRYYDKSGNEKTEKAYNKLFSTLRGPIDTSFVMGPGWSSWSEKYRTPGEPVRSPSLRRFMQLQARLISDDPQAIPALHRIKIDFYPPVAHSLGAEVWPAQVQAGQLDTFEVFVQPTFLEAPRQAQSLGFDEVLITAQPQLALHLLDVAVGTEAEFLQDQPLELFDQPHAEGLTGIEGALLQVAHSEGDSLWVRFPQPVQGSDSLPPHYYRTVADGEEVPTGEDETLLTVNSHALLPEAVRGGVRYFQRLPSGALEEVDQATYEGLAAADQGSIRYFRKVVGLGTQTSFDAAGDSLSASQHDQLAGVDRGWVVGRGRLVRLRFTSTVFLHGTQLQVAVRHSQAQIPWQSADAENVTGLRPSQGLSIGSLGGGEVIADVQIGPNPFTPNGDGINDVARIGFSLFKVYAQRPLSIRILALDGRPVRVLAGLVAGGAQEFVWDGRDAGGRPVAPGLYLCQIEVEADADDVAGQQRTHLLAVAY